MYFSLAAVNKSLVLVGGKDRKTTKRMDILGCGLLKHKGGVTPIRQCLLLIVRQLWLLIETGGCTAQCKFEINGTASPISIIITYSQLSTIAVMTGSGFPSLVHNLNRKFVIWCLTSGTWAASDSSISVHKYIHKSNDHSPI